MTQPDGWRPAELERVDSCPVCEESGRRVLYDDLTDVHGCGPWKLWQCARCGVAFLDPRRNSSGIAKAYEDYFTHVELSERVNVMGRLAQMRLALRNGYLNRRHNFALEPSSRLGPVVAQLFPARRRALDRGFRHLRLPFAGARLLDVGCGNGAFLQQMRAAGWSVDGVETDGQAVAFARRAGLRIHHGPLVPGLFPEGEFAAVTLEHVVEHLPDPVTTLAVCRRLIRPGGVVWVATPNLDSLAHARYGRDWRPLDPPRHLVVFTPTALRIAFERAGLGLLSNQPAAESPWMRVESETLRALRLGKRPPGRAANRLGAIVADIRARRNLSPAEELTVLATQNESSSTGGVRGRAQ